MFWKKSLDWNWGYPAYSRQVKKETQRIIIRLGNSINENINISHWNSSFERRHNTQKKKKINLRLTHERPLHFEAGARIDARASNKGKTPMDIARDRQKYDVVSLLQEHIRKRSRAKLPLQLATLPDPARKNKVGLIT